MLEEITIVKGKEDGEKGVTKNMLDAAFKNAKGSFVGNLFKSAGKGIAKSAGKYALKKAGLGFLFGPEPIDYMAVLNRIEDKIDVMDEKLNELLGITAATLSEVRRLSSIVTEEIKNQKVATLEDFVLGIDKLFGEITEYKIVSESIKFTDGKENTYDFQLERLFDFASKLDPNDQNDRSIIQFLDGNLEGHPTDDKIRILTEDFLSVDNQRSIKSLNDIFKTQLGTENSLEDIRIDANVQDLCANWMAVYNIAQSIVNKYAYAMNQLYYLQLLQLALYYSTPKYFKGTQLIRALINDPETDKLFPEGIEGFKLAAQNLNDYFWENEKAPGQRFIDTFGGRTTHDRGKLFSGIPNLEEYVRAVVGQQNKSIFMNGENNLLDTLAIVSFRLPANPKNLTVGSNSHLLGRIELSSLMEETDMSYVINVGHDIPYRSTYFENGYKLRTFGIQSFSFDQANLVLSPKYDLDYNYWNEISDDAHMVAKKNWVSAYNSGALVGLLEEDAIGLLVGSDGESTKTRNIYLGYALKFSEKITPVDSWTTAFNTEKNTNEHNRNANGEWVKGDDGRVKEIKYRNNKANKNYSNFFKGSPMTKQAWSETFLMSIPKSGNLFLINNDFPERKSQTNATFYGQFIMVQGFETMLDNKNYYCKTHAMSLHNPFELKKKQPQIWGSSFYSMGSEDQPMIPLSFQEYIKDGEVDPDHVESNPKLKPMEITAYGKLYAGGKYSYKEPFADTEINLDVKNIFKNYKINVDNSNYDQWHSELNKNELDYAYLDGTLYFSVDSHEDQTILTNGDYKLVYTNKGSLNIRKNDEDIVDIGEEISGKSDITASYLSLNNGDLALFNNDDKYKLLIEEAYAKNSLKWVMDKYSVLSLTEEGNLTIKSIATEVDNDTMKLGDKGTIFDLKWMEPEVGFPENIDN